MPVEISGNWLISAMDGADVRLRTGSIGLLNVDVMAPVRQGSLRIQAGLATLDLVIALDRLRTGNFLTEHAARSFLTGNDAHDLVYQAQGPAHSQPFEVSGQAQAGTLDLRIDLRVTLLGGSAPAEVELQGSASFGRVHIPIPGIGSVDDMNVDVDAKLALS
jgi:hypothetical protein